MFRKITALILAGSLLAQAWAADSAEVAPRQTLRHDGQTRSYLLGADAARPPGRVPLVLVLHGGGGNASKTSC